MVVFSHFSIFFSKEADSDYTDADSVYIPLSRYYKTPGRKSVVRIPFTDFEENVKGGKFDFAHLKDWTMVAMKPQGGRFIFGNMKLLGGPLGCIPTTNPQTTTTTTTTTSSSQPTATAKVEDGTKEISVSNAAGSQFTPLGLLMGAIPIALYFIL